MSEKWFRLVIALAALIASLAYAVGVTVLPRYDLVTEPDSMVIYRIDLWSGNVSYSHVTPKVFGADSKAEPWKLIRTHPLNEIFE